MSSDNKGGRYLASHVHQDAWMAMSARSVVAATATATVSDAALVVCDGPRSRAPAGSGREKPHEPWPSWARAGRRARRGGLCVVRPASPASPGSPGQQNIPLISASAKGPGPRPGSRARRDHFPFPGRRRPCCHTGQIHWAGELPAAQRQSGSRLCGASVVHAGPRIAARERHRLLAAFNGGFLLSAGAGGYEQEGHVIRPLRKGLASLVIDRSGTARVGVCRSRLPRAARCSVQRPPEPAPAG